MTYNPVQMPDTLADRLADIYWTVRPAVVKWLEENARPMLASFAFGAFMATAAVVAAGL
ncbi:MULTISPECIES: hypothetical protein [unclassified Mesorhizobium]|uniref:hypothetical protein n=1 Tax=unclassified Mesorhizobium TaxID=325217 RepID=UPI00142ED63A|nr:MULTISPECIES: hypothetical protein [unclassified Mesorhizobium]